MNDKKSVQNEENDDFESIDYSKIPDDVRKIVTPEPFEYTKSTTIVSDGKQLLVRIPRKIEKQYGLKKGQKMNFKLIVKNPENPKENTLEITINRDEFNGV